MYTLPNVLNKLEEINDIKQDISNALVNQGQNMTNTSFENFPEKVDNLKCNLSWVSFSNAPTEELEKNISLVNLDSLTSTYKLFNGTLFLINVPNFDTSKVTNMSKMFRDCYYMKEIPNYNTINVTNMALMFNYCFNLTNVPELNTSNVTNMSFMFNICNNLSNASVQNIVNMCLNSNITNTTLMNLNNANSYSPFYRTKFNIMYYSNRLSELTTAGWKY